MYSRKVVVLQKDKVNTDHTHIRGIKVTAKPIPYFRPLDYKCCNGFKTLANSQRFEICIT